MLTTHRRQLTIGATMLWISGIVVILALRAWSGMVAVLLAWPLAIWALSFLVTRWLGCSQLRAIVWLCAAYPWFALLFTMGQESGPIRPSTPWLGPIAGLILISLVWGLIAVSMGGLFLTLAELILTVERVGPEQGRQVIRLVSIPLVS